MTEQEIYQILREEIRPDFKPGLEGWTKVAKALHQKIEETTFATVEQIENSGWVSPECLEKTCSDLVDQHFAAEEKMKDKFEQQLLEELEKVKGKASLALYHRTGDVWGWLDHRINELKEELEKKEDSSEYCETCKGQGVVFIGGSWIKCTDCEKKRNDWSI